METIAKSSTMFTGQANERMGFFRRSLRRTSKTLGRGVKRFGAKNNIVHEKEKKDTSSRPFSSLTKDFLKRQYRVVESNIIGSTPVRSIAKKFAKHNSQASSKYHETYDNDRARDYVYKLNGTPRFDSYEKNLLVEPHGLYQFTTRDNGVFVKQCDRYIREYGNVEKAKTLFPSVTLIEYYKRESGYDARFCFDVNVNGKLLMYNFPSVMGASTSQIDRGMATIFSTLHIEKGTARDFLELMALRYYLPIFIADMRDLLANSKFECINGKITPEHKWLKRIKQSNPNDFRVGSERDYIVVKSKEEQFMTNNVQYIEKISKHKYPLDKWVVTVSDELPFEDYMFLQEVCRGRNITIKRVSKSIDQDVIDYLNSDEFKNSNTEVDDNTEEAPVIKQKINDAHCSNIDSARIPCKEIEGQTDKIFVPAMLTPVFVKKKNHVKQRNILNDMQSRNKEKGGGETKCSELLPTVPTAVFVKKKQGKQCNCVSKSYSRTVTLTRIGTAKRLLMNNKKHAVRIIVDSADLLRYTFKIFENKEDYFIEAVNAKTFCTITAPPSLYSERDYVDNGIQYALATFDCSDNRLCGQCTSIRWRGDMRVPKQKNCQSYITDEQISKYCKMSHGNEFLHENCALQRGELRIDDRSERSFCGCFCGRAGIARKTCRSKASYYKDEAYNKVKVTTDLQTVCTFGGRVFKTR